MDDFCGDPSRHQIYDQLTFQCFCLQNSNASKPGLSTGTNVIKIAYVISRLHNLKTIFVNTILFAVRFVRIFLISFHETF